jgi:hypothetical protein
VPLTGIEKIQVFAALAKISRDAFHAFATA